MESIFTELCEASMVVVVSSATRMRRFRSQPMEPNELRKRLVSPGQRIWKDASCYTMKEHEKAKLSRLVASSATREDAFLSEEEDEEPWTPHFAAGVAVLVCLGWAGSVGLILYLLKFPFHRHYVLTGLLLTVPALFLVGILFAVDRAVYGHEHAPAASDKLSHTKRTVSRTSEARREYYTAGRYAVSSSCSTTVDSVHLSSGIENRNFARQERSWSNKQGQRRPTG